MGGVQSSSCLSQSELDGRSIHSRSQLGTALALVTMDLGSNSSRRRSSAGAVRTLDRIHAVNRTVRVGSELSRWWRELDTHSPAPLEKDRALAPESECAPLGAA